MNSYKGIPLKLKLLSSIQLSSQHDKVVSGRNSLQKAFPHTIFFITRKSCSFHIFYAFIKAHWNTFNFEISFEICSVVVIILVLDFSVKHFLDCKEFRPLSKESIMIHVYCIIQHSVLIIFNIKLMTFFCFLSFYSLCEFITHF